MILNELGITFSEMYNDAPKGYADVMTHLFGIKYANEIKKNSYSKKDILVNSGISSRFITELNNRIKLSEYVIPMN